MDGIDSNARWYRRALSSVAPVGGMRLDSAPASVPRASMPWRALTCLLLAAGCRGSAVQMGAPGAGTSGQTAGDGAIAGAGAGAGMGVSGSGGHAAGSGAAATPAAGSAGGMAGAAAIGGMGGAGSPAAGSGAGGHAAGSGGSAGTGSTTARPEVVYVSGYGPNITVFGLDRSTGALTKLGSVAGGMSPSYLASAPNQHFLYAINEVDAPNSVVVAFAIDAADGHLTKINSATTGGSGSPFLAVDPSGQWIAVAHYTSGETSILPIRADGGVSAASDINKGPGAGCMQAHHAVFDASGTHLLVPCLGSNFVIQFKFSAGKLSYNDPATVSVSGGPRHLALSPDEHHAYVLSELSSTITSFSYDAATGRLSDPQVIDSAQATAGESAQIVVHPSGAWLYASNRKENSLGLFSIDAQGRPHAETFETDMIATPRDFSVDPLGHFLILANQDGPENVLVYSIATANGHLTRTQVVPVGGQPTFTRTIVLP